MGALDLASQPWEVNNRNGRKVCAKNNVVKGGFWSSGIVSVAGHFPVFEFLALNTYPPGSDLSHC